MLGPGLWGVVISFTNEALTGPAAADPQFVGLDNYERALSDDLFLNSVWRSFLFVLFTAIIGQVGLGLLLAVLTSQRRKVSRRIQMLARVVMILAFVAWITPETLVGFSWITFLDFDGTFNQFIGLSGREPTFWLVRFALPSIIAANIWWGTGWSMLLFKSAIESIPQEIEEAAEVDGASGWQRFRRITLPLLRGPMLVNLILITIWTYGVFGSVWILTAGGPGHRTELMTIYAYKQAFKFFDLSYGTTVSVGILLITLVMALLYYSVMRARGEAEGGL
jgi:multiple sugar transport system permease protein